MSRIASRYSVSLERSLLPRPCLQAIDVAGDVVEDAALLLERGETGLSVGGIAVAEEALEEGARVGLHGQRRGVAAPGDGVGICAAIAGIAAAGEARRVEADLERAELGALAECLGGDLVHRDAGVNAGAFGLLGWTPVSQVAPARAWSPGPSPSARPLICARPVRTLMFSAIRRTKYTT